MYYDSVKGKCIIKTHCSVQMAMIGIAKCLECCKHWVHSQHNFKCKMLIFFCNDLSLSIEFALVVNKNFECHSQYKIIDSLTSII